MGILLLAATEQQADAAVMTFHVNSAADPGVGVCDVAECTLREAITAANTNPGHDTIDFDTAVFTPDVHIEVVSELPYVDASEGITMDGTVIGNVPDDHVFIDGTAADGAYGLVFVSTPGEDIQDVIVRNMYVEQFDQNGIQFCPGGDPINFICQDDTNNVLLDSAVVAVSSTEGIKFVGTNVSNVTMEGVNSAFNNSHGVAFDVLGDVEGIHETDGAYLNNGGSGFYIDAEAHNITDVTFARTWLGGNGANGIRLYAQDITGVHATGLLLDENSAKGIQLQANGNTSDVEIKDGQPSSNTDGGVDISTNTATNVRVLNNILEAPAGEGVRIDFNSGTGIRIGNNQINESALGIVLRGGTTDLLTIDGNTVSNSANSGIVLESDLGGGAHNITGLSVEDNDVLGNGGHGIFVRGDNVSGFVTGNLVDNNSFSGITVVSLQDGDNRVTIANNQVTRNGDHGISVEGAAAVISRNSVSANGGIGIDVVKVPDAATGVTPNDPGDGDSLRQNAILNFPVITANVDHTVTGTTCPDCLVELFLADGDATGHGEGATFIGDTTADGSGNFTVSLCGHAFASGAEVTATATGQDNPLALLNTSEFSDNFTVAEFDGNCGPTTTPAPGEIVWGDLDCDGEITPFDALIALLFLEDLPFDQDEPCPDPDEEVGDFRFADVNCDGVIDELDAVAILAYVADVPIPPESGCPPIGDSL